MLLRLHTGALPDTLLRLVDATPVPAVHVGVVHCAEIVLAESHVTVPDTDHPVNTILVRVNWFAVPDALLHAGRVNVSPCEHVNVTLVVPVWVTPFTVNVPEPLFLLIVIE